MKKKVRKIVKKIVTNTLKQEGTGDKYLASKYPSMFVADETENEYLLHNVMQQNLDNVFYLSGDWAIIKNPKSLENFGSNVRGVITKNGDLYLETYSNAIHHDIIKKLFEKGLIKTEFTKKWTRKTPEENGFLTVQRKGNTNTIAVGESNKIVYDEKMWEKLKPQFDSIIELAKQKNSNIEFTNKLIGIKFNTLKSQSKKNRITEANSSKNILKN